METPPPTQALQGSRAPSSPTPRPGLQAGGHHDVGVRGAAVQLCQRAEQANFRPEDQEVIIRDASAGQRGSSTGLAMDWTAILRANFRSIDRPAILPMYIAS